MYPDLQRRIQRFGWDKAAPHYDSGWQRQLRPAQERMLTMAALHPGLQVLDVACGTGLVTLPAARAVFPGGDILGTDISEGMIEQARKLAKKQNVKNVAFRRMDAEKLELPDDAFDVVLCSLGLMYAPDPLQALVEMRRVLKPGGRAVALVWGERRNCGWAEIFPIVDRNVASEVCPLFFQQGAGDTLRNSFEAAGFTTVRDERLTIDIHFESDNDALASTFEAGAVALAYNKFDEPTRKKVHAEYLESIALYKNKYGDDYDIPGEFVVAEGFNPDSVSSHK